jgi:hypothetical protein
VIERSAKNVGAGKRAANRRSTIIRRPDGRWPGWVSMGLLPSGKPDRRHVSAKTQSGAPVEVRALERAREAGSITATGHTPLVAYLEEWINRKERLCAVRPNTIDGYRNDLAHVKVALPKVTLDRLGPGNRAPVVVSDRPRPDRWAHTANAQRPSGHSDAVNTLEQHSTASLTSDGTNNRDTYVCAVSLRPSTATKTATRPRDLSPKPDKSPG